MGFKTFAAGSVLTAADVNDYLMKQSVITCTSATRPGSPVEGMVIYQTDTGSLLIYNGTTWVDYGGVGAWSTYTPTWTSTGTAPSFGNAVIRARYRKIGLTVDFRMLIIFGSSTTFGTGSYRFALPTPAVSGVGRQWNGGGNTFDSSAAIRSYATSLIEDGGTYLTVYVLGSSGADHFGVTNAVPYTFAVNDEINVHGSYESAA